MRKRILLREPYQSRYKRWEDRRIEQFGFVNNLLVGLSSVLLFWMLQGALEDKLPVYDCVFWAVLTSGICFFLSLSSGLWLALNRLADFRRTAALIKTENERAYYVQKQDDEQVQKQKSEIEQKKKENSEIGVWSWGLIYAQFILFFLGFLALGVGVIIKITGY